MGKQVVHFNISERKILLRIMDLISVLLVLCFISIEFNFDYFTISVENWSWVLVLILYITVFGTVFELYDLQNDPEEMDNLANPEHPKYDEELLARLNEKLNALIVDEIGDDSGMRERLMQH